MLWILRILLAAVRVLVTTLIRIHNLPTLIYTIFIIRGEILIFGIGVGEGMGSVRRTSLINSILLESSLDLNGGSLAVLWFNQKFI